MTQLGYCRPPIPFHRLWISEVLGMLKMNVLPTTGVVAGLILVTPFLLFPAAPSDLFEIKVRPALAKNCYECHGARAMGGLRLDSRAGLLKGGASGRAVIVGKPDESLLIRAVRYGDSRLKMP